MLLYCTMISFGFVCHRQGVSPFSKQGWGSLENILHVRTYTLSVNILYTRKYISFYKISSVLVNISCLHNIFRIPLHNDSFGVFWNDIIFYGHFIHQNKIMPNLCLILSRSKFGYIVCWIEVLDLSVEYGRRKYQRRRSNIYYYTVMTCI